MKISDIKPNPQNPRTIKDDNFKKLVQSIKDFPEMLDARPLVINKDNIILGGNMRFKASKEAGLKEVPVKIVDWSEEKQREFIIKDNISGGDWDWDQLANEWDVEQLDEWGLDVPDFAGDVEVEEDEAPEVSDEPPVSKLGEVYQLGRHRIMCADSTVKENVELLMDGNMADMVFTDPPYGIAYSSRGTKLGNIENDDLGDDGTYDLIHDCFENYYEYTINNAPVYCWYSDKYMGIFRDAIESVGFEYKQNLIWVKGMGMGFSDYRNSHEPCMYFQKSGEKANYYGGRGNATIMGKTKTDIASMSKANLVASLVNSMNERTVWEFDKDGVTTYVHPTQKPITLAYNAITNGTEDGDIVIDFFLGSGSTLIACEQTDRTCYGMELDEKYLDVIRKRWAKYVYPDRWEKEWEILTPEAV